MYTRLLHLERDKHTHENPVRVFEKPLVEVFYVFICDAKASYTRLNPERENQPL